MDTSPQISIVTPSFNQAPFLRRTIESVLNQQVELEYIVIDACSTDGSLEILKDYQRGATIIIEEDNGQSDAIAKGFAMARGKILAWLNADDIYLPGALKKVLDAFTQGEEFVYGHTWIIDADDVVLRKRVVIPVDFKDLYFGHYTLPQESTFFSKDLYERCGGINKDLAYAMDYDLWLRMALLRKPKTINAFLSAFRFHANQKSRQWEHCIQERNIARNALLEVSGPFPAKTRTGINASTSPAGYSPTHIVHRWRTLRCKYWVKLRTIWANVCAIGFYGTLRDGFRKKMGALP